MILGRLTEWEEQSEGIYCGLGQKMYATDQNDYPLLEIREIKLDVEATAEARGIGCTVAELSLQEKLQPALLDRLADHEPDKKVESRAKRVLSLNRLKSSVLRDLAWLLNCGNLEVTEDLDDYPEVRKSVLNYGVPDLAGKTVSATEVGDLEREIRQAILNFEPRILADSLSVRVSINRDRMSTKTMSFVIEGQLMGAAIATQPLPEHGPGS